MLAVYTKSTEDSYSELVHVNNPENVNGSKYGLFFELTIRRLLQFIPNFPKKRNFLHRNSIILASKQCKIPFRSAGSKKPLFMRKYTH